MCVEPTTALIMMGASTAVSAATSAISAASSAKARNRQADYNSQVARNNAEIARQEGRYAKAQALRNATGKRRETAVVIGAQRARQGAAGVVVDSGSASDVALNTAEQGERAAVALLQQGDLDSWRAENQARGYEQQSVLAESGKVSVGSAVAGSLLSSAAGATMRYASMGGFSGARAGAAASTGAAAAGGTSLSELSDNNLMPKMPAGWNTWKL